MCSKQPQLHLPPVSPLEMTLIKNIQKSGRRKDFRAKTKKKTPLRHLAAEPQGASMKSLGGILQ